MTQLYGFLLENVRVTHIITRQFWNTKCRWFISKLISFVEGVPCGAYVTYKSSMLILAWHRPYNVTRKACGYLPPCMWVCRELSWMESADLRQVHLYNDICITLSNDDILETEYRLVAAGDWRMSGGIGCGYRRREGEWWIGSLPWMWWWYADLYTQWSWIEMNTQKQEQGRQGNQSKAGGC